MCFSVPKLIGWFPVTRLLFFSKYVDKCLKSTVFVSNLLSKLLRPLIMFTKLDCHVIKCYCRKPMRPLVSQAQRHGVSLQMVTCKPANPYMMAWFSKEKVPGSPMQCQQLSFFTLSPTRVFPSIPIAFLHLPSFCFFPLLFCTWLFLLPLNNFVFLHLCSFPLQFLNLWAQWIWGIFLGYFIKTEEKHQDRTWSHRSNNNNTLGDDGQWLEWWFIWMLLSMGEKRKWRQGKVFAVYW